MYICDVTKQQKHSRILLMMRKVPSKECDYVRYQMLAYVQITTVSNDVSQPICGVKSIFIKLHSVVTLHSIE